MSRLIHHFPTLGRLLHRVAASYVACSWPIKAAINLVGWGGLLYVVYFFALAAPVNFPVGAYIKVVPGESLQSIAQHFEERGVVHSALLFKVAGKLLGDERKIPAGVYYFAHKQNLFWVAERLISGDFETTPVRVLVPEGATNKDIATLLSKKVPEFRAREFLLGAREGYMFPDTYFLRPGDDAQAILSVFANNFQVQIRTIQKQIDASGKSQEDLVVMASLLEKEAAKTEDRRRIAGVLWRRIDIGMPLQVDAVFPYIIGKNTFQLTTDDLKIDNPYNTYKYKGLPPGAIDNPSLNSVLAAATPIKSNYLFYLSDRQGNFHFAVTYAQHLANKQKYLGN